MAESTTCEEASRRHVPTDVGPPRTCRVTLLVLRGLRGGGCPADNRILTKETSVVRNSFAGLSSISTQATEGYLEKQIRRSSRSGP